MSETVGVVTGYSLVAHIRTYVDGKAVLHDTVQLEAPPVNVKALMQAKTTIALDRIVLDTDPEGDALLAAERPAPVKPPPLGPSDVRCPQCGNISSGHYCYECGGFLQ